MIVEFSVTNFRSIKDKQTISFEATVDKTYEEYLCVEKSGLKLLKMAALIGKNASGKSNLLLALDFLRDFISETKHDKGEGTGFIPFLLDDVSASKTGKFELTFFANNIKYIYSLEIDTRKVYRENMKYYPGSKPARFFSRQYDESKSISTVDFGGTVKLKKADRDAIQRMTTVNSSVISAIGKVNVESKALNEIYAFFEHNFLPIILPKTLLNSWALDQLVSDSDCINFVMELLGKADFSIRDIKIDEFEYTPDAFIKQFPNSGMLSSKFIQVLKEGIIKEKTLTVYHNTESGKKELDFELESSGTQRFLGLITVLKKLLLNRILTIDELESSLHPDLISHFLKTYLANSEESQLIFTTHNFELISKDFFRPDMLWICEKNSDNSTEVYSAADFDLPKKPNIYYLYSIGKLGGKPSLGSEYLENNGAKKKK